ncbi:MAG: PEP-CTERM sorting domain-containing protein [Planctomycetia bacterium]|nr:PEP-CTERM sorting domain-containing protein [Planctomycetia bacterium]
MKWAVKSFAFLAVCLALTNASRAATVSYTINPDLSFLTMSGEVIGTPVTPQVVGADIAYYQGTITGDLTAGVLTFSGGSIIDALVNPAGPFQLNTLPGEDNYGVAAGAVPVAFRNIMMEIATGTVQDGVVPTGMDLPVSFTINSPLASGDDDDTTPNSTALLASLSTAGNIETLTIPILRNSGEGGALHIVLEGQLVASRVVPEPSSIALLGLGSVVSLGLAWRRLRSA